MKSAGYITSIPLAVALLGCAGMLHARQLAFPTAEGYGKYSVGGRGGRIYEVTTLNSSGPGSLGAAIGASGPRTVVFRVSGTIEGKFSIRNDKITIAGQTAPGDGICIKGSLSIGANDAIIRYIRVRANPTVETDAIGGRYHKNIILDHVSASWSSDEVMSLYHNQNVTIQWCMITEACAKGDSGHRFGGIWGSQYATYHHNLIAHSNDRNPYLPTEGEHPYIIDVVNNVVYNWGFAAGVGYPKTNHNGRINFVGNLYIKGPDSRDRPCLTMGVNTQIHARGNIGANDVIIRYIRVRANPAVETDAVGGRYKKNIILDHVTASWSSDEILSLYHNENVTIQWCMITEACAKGDSGHRFGGIWGNQYGTYHHNLIAHNDSRNPRWASGCGFNDYRNNVLYNWGYQSSYGAEAHQRGDRRKPPIEFSTINIIANYYKPGPATDSGVKDRVAEPSARAGDDKGSWYVAHNVVEGYPAVTANNWEGIDGSNYIRLNKPWPAMAINQQTPEAAYRAILAHSGCSKPNRDSVDGRIIEEVRKGTATCGEDGIITTPSDVGGWPNLKGASAPVDSDHDGMSDAWEKAHGLDPSNKNDGKKTNLSADSYTNLEMYLNELAGDPVKWAK